MRSSNNVHYERYHDPSRVPLKLMNDEDVFKEELEKIFSRSWVFLGLADEMENPIVFFTPILVIGVTIYILLKLYLNDLIFFMLLLTLFIIDMTLSYKRAKD